MEINGLHKLILNFKNWTIIANGHHKNHEKNPEKS
jgi:hypothetical protein